MPAFQPYWGKPAVRNDRGERGDVGIIRSPVRASFLPDCGGYRVTGIPTATATRDAVFTQSRSAYTGTPQQPCIPSSTANPRCRGEVFATLLLGLATLS